MIRVVLADAQALVRDGLRYVLAANPGFEVVGEARDGQQAVNAALDLHPDVIIIDAHMPDLDGIEATRQIHASGAGVKVLILSTHDESDYVSQALQAGAAGYLLKESPRAEIVEALRTVVGGGWYFSQPIVSLLVEGFLRSARDRQDQGRDDVLARLSRREREILRLVLTSQTSAEIGKALYLSPKTVATYRSRIMHKLGVTNLVELVRLAVRLGL